MDAASADRGKPSPDPYLVAAERLGARPEDCLVIEDTPSGVQAGVSAGMTVWSVNAPVPVAGAHRHFATLRDAASDILSWTACSAR